MHHPAHRFPPAKEIGRSFQLPTGYLLHAGARFSEDRCGNVVYEIPLFNIAPIPPGQNGILLVEVFDMTGEDDRVVGQCVMTRDHVSTGISGVWVEPSHHGHDIDAFMVDLAKTIFGGAHQGLAPCTYRINGSQVTLIEQEPSRLVKPGDYL